MRSNRASKTGIQLKMFRKQLTKQFRGLSIIKTCGATRNPEFPRTGPKPVRGRGTFLRIFSGRVGSGNFISGRSGSGNFISGRSGSGYFFTGV